MEEALTVLEEAESLLKEEELAERDRAGESWASSVYLAKGRVLEALDSRPQVLSTLTKNKRPNRTINLLFKRRQKPFKLPWNKISCVWKLLRLLSSIRC